jgi:hypothetical protein
MRKSTGCSTFIKLADARTSLRSSFSIPEMDGETPPLCCSCAEGADCSSTIPSVLLIWRSDP